MSGKGDKVPGNDLDREEQKALIKEAFREWLDEKYAEFGKWTFNKIMGLCFVAVVSLLVIYGFWK
jgi:hypothetical protein